MTARVRGPRFSGSVRPLRWTLAALMILAALFLPGPGGPRWLRTGGSVRAATFVPNDFVVINNQFGSNPAVLRFNLSGAPDPAPGASGATYLPGVAQSVAWSPDGNLYRINTFQGGVDSFDVDTNTLTPIISAAVAQGGAGLAFGPDGNLYVGRAGSGYVDRYCGPLNATCAPGTPLPSGQPGTTDPAFYALGGGFDIVFGADGNLYEFAGSFIRRFCGPLNTSCAPGAPAGLTGTPTDPTWVSLGPTASTESLAFGPDGNFYVGDVGSRSVLRFCGGPNNGSNCSEATPAPAFGQSGAVFVHFVLVGSVIAGLDFGLDGNLYVNLGDEIDRFLGPNCTPAFCEGSPDPAPGQSGATLVPFGTGGLSFPNYLKFPHILPPLAPPATFTLFVGNQPNKVLRYNASTGAPFPAPGQSGADFVGLMGPTGLVIGPDRNLYVGSGTTLTVLRLDAQTGVPLPTKGNLGADFTLTGFPLGGPEGVAFGPDGDLYVSSMLTDSVQRFHGPFSSSGSPGFPHPAQGQSGADFIPSGAGGLRSPGGIAFGPDQNLYVASLEFGFVGTPHDDVLRFDGQTGQFLDKFVQGINSPLGIVFGPDGNLYVDDGNNLANTTPLNKVERFDGNTGALLSAPGQSGADFVPFVGAFSPGGLAFGPDGKLYVPIPSANGSSGSIMRFDGQTGAFVDTFVNGLDFPLFLTFGSTVFSSSLRSLTGGVFHDSVSPSNALPLVQVQAAQRQPGGLFSCPNAGFFFIPCPSTTTDAAGQFSFSGLAPGTEELTAWPPANLAFFPNSILVNLPSGSGPPITGQDIVLVPPIPIPANASVSPVLGLAPVTGGNVPVAGWNNAFTLTALGCPGGNASFTVTDATSHQLASGTLLLVAPATFSTLIGPFNPFKGLATVSITFSNCLSGGVPPPINFTIYIDPSGTVVDDVTGLPILGATVTLFRSDTAKGAFTQVPQGSAFMSLSNRNNPDQTNAAGQYGWDVAPGFYQLQASAPGFTCDPNKPPHGFTCVNGAVQSGVFAIPPAVTDLKLPLHRTSVNLPPVARIAPAVSPVECASHSGTPITLDGSASSDPDGDTLTFTWTEDGNPVGGNSSMLTVTVPLGAHTFALTVTDPGGLSNTATAQITVRDTTPPTLTLSTTSITVVLPTATAAGATVSLSGIASATDICDPSPTVTNNAPANSFFPIGTTTVTFTATDHSGNSTQKQLTVQVVYNFLGYFTPLLNNGSAIYQSGRTLPAKFQLTAADGTIVTNAVATIQVFQVLSTPTGTVDETVNTVASGSSNTGNLYRFDPISNQYLFNLSTQGFASGTYLLRTTINDGTTHDVNFSIK